MTSQTPEDELTESECYARMSSRVMRKPSLQISGGLAIFTATQRRAPPAIMNELIFLVEGASESGFTARALGESIFTKAETLEELRQQVRDAVRCHFDDGKAPKVIRVHP